MLRFAPLCLIFAASVGWAQGAATGDPAALAEAIDRHISLQWQQHGVQPADLAADADFLRRVYLDVAGQIPPVSETRDFLSDPSADKRARLIDRLLDSPLYVTHFTGVWRRWLLSEADSSLEIRFLVPGFEMWLRKQLVENRPYDQMVQELLTVDLPAGNQPLFAGSTDEPTPVAFFQAKEHKPENLAAASARLFLGLRVECAQCHDHPFAHWKRDDFWRHAAFFAGAEPPPRNGLLAALRKLFQRREIAIPGTNEIVEARYLTREEPVWEVGRPARHTLAVWLTAPENPYFARATVNRLWSHFFGIGLVEPVDEMDEHNPPSHPELLKELSRQFVDSRFDLKFLIRSITRSRAYQLSSRRTHPSQDDPRLFARMAVRGLSPEQLVASLVQATGMEHSAGDRNPFAQGDSSPEREIREHFEGSGQPTTEYQTSILQALALMNGRLVARATSVKSSRTLAAVVECPLFDTRARIETLYLAALSRPPESSELEKFVQYVEDAEQPDKALSDVFWALLNTSEFLFNH